jgi:hypothetical protein
MNIKEKIIHALSLAERYPAELTGQIIVQLKYCLDVINEQEESNKIEKLNMGFLVLKYNEVSFSNEFCSLVSDIDFEIKQTYLSYAAKVRLGIHKKGKST